MRRMVHVCVAGLLVAGLFVSGCASGSERETNKEDPRQQSATEEARVYGDDPMGVAQRWADEPPASAPAKLRERVADWESPVVARVVRRDESYRAILTRSASERAEAVRLEIERRDGRWTVVEASSASARYLWSDM